MNLFTEIEILSFDRIAFAHSLSAVDYHYALQNNGYGIYAETPENGGILEIGFVEQNPVILTGPLGIFRVKENAIFIIPPHCDFSVRAERPDVHRHTCVEFLIRCHAKQTACFSAPQGQTVTLPLIIPPSHSSSEVFDLIRSISLAWTTHPDRGYFAECADFMALIHRLTVLIRENDSTDPVSPGSRRYCDRAKAFISQNIDRRLTVGEIADAVGISKNYLTNVFSSSEGISLMEYINRRKLTYMLELIRRYDYTLAQAGEHVGYTDVNYISRIFRRYYGMTVTEYKQSLETEVSP